MADIFIHNPLLLLFLVASFGYLFGSIKIKGNSLGVAAVLFVGLVFGMIDPKFQIPDIIFSLGLVFFVYSIGLSSGPAFFKSYRINGLRDISFILITLVFSGIIAIALAYLSNISAAATAGFYAGSTTNTPALASVLDLINNADIPNKNLILDEAVVGYTYSYPMGVLGSMIAILIMQKFLKIDYQKEYQQYKSKYDLGENLSSKTVIISNPKVVGKQLRDIWKENKFDLVFGRIARDNEISLANWNSILKQGDHLMIVGNKEELEQAAHIFGKSAKHKLTLEKSAFDSRSIFVSNAFVVGRSIASLNLGEKFNAIITRIRRGETDILAKGNTILELGDRIRFVASRKDLKSLSNYFGDSYAGVSKVNLFTYGLGIGLGLILGTINFNLGFFSFKLGYAGGPLVIGLILGSMRRTGPIVWTLPYAANQTLKQLGLILLLAVIGVKSGHAFADNLNMTGFLYFVCGTIVSLTTAIFALLIGYKFLKIPFSMLMGMVSNQPAILDFALDKSKNNLPIIGYTMMFPIALVTKLIIAQLIYLILIG